MGPIVVCKTTQINPSKAVRMRKISKKPKTVICAQTDACECRIVLRHLRAFFLLQNMQVLGFKIFLQFFEMFTTAKDICTCEFFQVKILQKPTKTR